MITDFFFADLLVVVVVVAVVLVEQEEGVVVEGVAVDRPLPLKTSWIKIWMHTNKLVIMIILVECVLI